MNMKGFSIEILLTFVTIFVVLYSSEACFIRNCPPGGKRSMGLMSRGTRPCLSCGPGDSGQCVGPNICCGVFGCLMDTAETEICQKEDDSTEPCEVEGETCGVHGQGNCVADGICCDSVACSVNSKCQLLDTDSKSERLLSLLDRLLDSRDIE